MAFFLFDLVSGMGFLILVECCYLIKIGILVLHSFGWVSFSKGVVVKLTQVYRTTSGCILILTLWARIVDKQVTHGSFVTNDRNHKLGSSMN